MHGSKRAKSLKQGLSRDLEHEGGPRLDKVGNFKSMEAMRCPDLKPWLHNMLKSKNGPKIS